jgi:hypothetical protein
LERDRDGGHAGDFERIIPDTLVTGRPLIVLGMVTAPLRQLGHVMVIAPLLVVKVNWACTAVGSANSSSGSNFMAQAVRTAGNRSLGAPPGRENWFLVALMFHHFCGCYWGTGPGSSAKFLFGREVLRWLAGNGADAALDGLGRTEAKAVCALTPHPPHSKTLARDRAAILEAAAKPIRFNSAARLPAKHANILKLLEPTCSVQKWRKAAVPFPE